MSRPWRQAGDWPQLLSDAPSFRLHLTQSPEFLPANSYRSTNFAGANPLTTRTLIHFSHDVPAVRGDDLVDDALDGSQSLAFVRAQHKLSSAMVVLEWCLATQ